MSAVTTPAACDDGRLLVRPPSLGRRRPVQTFVGLIALTCLVLFGLGRTGVAAPQVALRPAGSIGDGSTTYAPTYAVVNHGLRPVEVVAVRSSGTVRVLAPDTDVHQPGGVPGTLPAFVPLTIPGGGHRNLAVDLGPPCPGGMGFRALRVEIEVRSADLGVQRTLVVDEGAGVC